MVLSWIDDGGRVVGEIELDRWARREEFERFIERNDLSGKFADAVRLCRIGETKRREFLADGINIFTQRLFV